MLPLFTAEQMRTADRYTIETVGIPGLVLMEHAAMAVVRSLKRRFGNGLAGSRGVILVGRGNNGGDGLAVARLLVQQGVERVLPVLIGKPEELSEEASAQLAMLAGLGVARGTELEVETLEKCDWIVDALLGTGGDREVTGRYREWIETVNRYADRKWIVAVDLPSGLSCDRGRVQGAAVRASETVTLGFVKRGLVTGEAADYVGRLSLAPIQIPREIPGIVPQTLLWRARAARLPERRPAAHKGDFGQVSILAGTPETQGAAVLAGWGALRSGAGRVTLVGPAETLDALRPRLAPELMTSSADPKGVVVAGPGLGALAGDWVQTLVSGSLPLVLDADALNFIASHPNAWKSRRSPTVWTPHPKEASRLLGWDVEEVEADRYRALTELVSRYKTTVVLKGKGTLIGHPGAPVLVVTRGNTVLSKGGSGDLLAGIIGALLAQGLDGPEAAALGVYLEGRAAERIAQRSGTERNAVATEVADEMGRVWRELEHGSD